VKAVSTIGERREKKTAKNRVGTRGFRTGELSPSGKQHRHELFECFENFESIEFSYHRPSLDREEDDKNATPEEKTVIYSLDFFLFLIVRFD